MTVVHHLFAGPGVVDAGGMYDYRGCCDDMLELCRYAEEQSAQFEWYHIAVGAAGLDGGLTMVLEKIRDKDGWHITYSRPLPEFPVE